MGVDLHSRPLASRELRATLVLGAAVTLIAIVLPIVSPPKHMVGPGLTVLYMCLLGAVLRLSIQLGSSLAEPAELVFIPFLVVVPASLVPLCVILAYALTIAPGVLLHNASPSRLTKAPMWSAFSVGPALLLAVTGSSATFLHSPGLIAAVIAAQFAGNLLCFGSYVYVVRRVRFREFVEEARVAYAMDLLLLPVGVFIALAVQSAPWRLALITPLLIMFAALMRERRMRVKEALELSDAYHGTVLVLGDIIEHDDTYTGEHSRGVVELSLAVANKLGLSPEKRLRVEFGARLHDVGKVAVPNEIINKPGALDEREWEIIKMHTVEGQRILNRAGGLMREIGVVVRSSHERWDGTGYPDGLAGTAIPIESRVVTACDAFNAMITTRSYRKAMSKEAAVAELEGHAGTQFDPAVVQAVVEVVCAPEATAATTMVPSVAESDAELPLAA
jgi:HD-GYP domain-containing protein (c-di-GMP phosphodiesterase class II)